MKIIVFLGVLVLGHALPALADVPSPNIVQLLASAIFGAGDSSITNPNVLTTPSDKRLVIQSVSFYTFRAAAGSSMQVFLGTNILNNDTF